MNCGLVRRHLDAYVDGEVDPNTQIDFERHMAACAACQELLDFTRQMKREVHQSCRAIKAPAALRSRICAAMDEADRSDRSIRLLAVPKRVTIPLAVAAATLMAVTWGIGSGGETRTAGTTTMPVFEDVVRVHASELPADAQADEPREVQDYFRNKVDFRVRPAQFERRDARLVGVRLSNVRERRAAALYYDVGGRRMTVVVFDRPQTLGHEALRARLLGRELYYQQVHGYTVPVRKEEGLNYAFTGDLDRRDLLQLAATARVIH